MQTKIDWTTGGLKFYDADPPKKQKQGKFQSNGDINQDFDPKPSTLSIQKRIELINSVGKEIINGQLLEQRMKSKTFLKAYDGFEPSGRMHIAQGLLRAINVNKMVDAGCIFIFWVADYFAMLNGKFDGDLEKIRTVGKYFIEVWKAVGMKTQNVKFLWASEEINSRSNDYWLQDPEVCDYNGEKVIRPIEGVSVIFIPVCNALMFSFQILTFVNWGLIKERWNMLAVEYAGNNEKKPIIVSHGMISGLLEGQQKMSKSDSDSAIFMEDTAKEVERKIKKSFCPQKIIQNNPVIDYCQNIIFNCRGELSIARKQENGGNITFKSYSQLESAFVEGKLHPNDLKPAVAKVLNELIEPVRKHFQTNPRAKALLNTINSYKKQTIPTILKEE